MRFEDLIIDAEGVTHLFMQCIISRASAEKLNLCFFIISFSSNYYIRIKRQSELSVLCPDTRAIF